MKRSAQAEEDSNVGAPDPEAYKDLVATAIVKENEKALSKEAVARGWRPMTAELNDKFGEEAVRKMSEEEKLQKFRELHTCADIDNVVHEPAPAKKPSVPKTLKQRSRKQMVKALELEEARLKAEKKMLKSVGQIGQMTKEMKMKMKNSCWKISPPISWKTF